MRPMSSSKATGIVTLKTKKRPKRGEIYLKAGMSGGTMHCFVVARVKPKKMRGKLFNFDDIIY